MSGMQYVNKFGDVRIAVIGDYMLDEYLVGTARRVSPEAPVPVLHLNREEQLLGGAGNVAANLRALGCKVDSYGVVGDDPAGQSIQRLLDRMDICTAGVLVDRTRPTVQKVRLVAERHQLARYDRELTHPLNTETAERLWELLKTRDFRYDAIVLSDYAKGTLSRELQERVITEAGRAGMKTVVDPKGNDFTRYRGAASLTPNESEALLAAGRAMASGDELIEIAHGMVDSLRLEALCITRGPEGVLLVQSDGSVHALPTQAHEVFDVTGAGDTYLSGFAAAIAAGATYKDAARLGNQAAGLAVARRGTAVVTQMDLAHSLAGDRKICTQAELLPLLEQLRNSGKRVVFTNGCFDILHAGHVKYLERARSLGDCLVLGLNTDASVRRLKGPSRPLVAERDRALILASLRFVDYVVLFDDDTPLRLIECLRPHVLVKGADYSRERVVGHELVESWGGRVELIDFVEGRSTTKLIGNILERHLNDSKETGNGLGG